MKKILILLLIILIGGLGAVGYVVKDMKESYGVDVSETVSPLSKTNIFDSLTNKDSEEQEAYVPDTDLATKDILNILLLGIDRRSKQELGYRTDIMILLSINKTDNIATLTSVPRDLWFGSGRINALYVSQGWEGVQDAFGQITGQTPDRYILTDFEDFSWIVDQMGGVPVTVETTFTDSLYPVDATKEYQTISFVKGPELLTGERALIFARSRKGDNDNGDWGRMRRQHLILKGMLEAATQPKSFICKEASKNSTETCESSVDSTTITNILGTVTNKGMESNFEVSDLVYLWDFYTQRNDYKIESLLMDYEYLHTPPASEYGGAWVLAPKENSYTRFRTDLSKLISGEPIAPLDNDLTAEEVPVETQ